SPGSTAGPSFVNAASPSPINAARTPASRISGKGTKDNIVTGQAVKKKEHEQEYILIPICTTDPLISQGPKDSVVDAGNKATKVDASQFQIMVGRIQE
nr:hypothetical protein [Tanacetum cinerariifolium]